jgi:replication factor C large subunit
MSVTLSEKYRAKNYSEILGQEKAISELEIFFKEFPKKKGVILHGLPGVGKTSLAWASSREKNLDILELNSSDLRNRAKLEQILKPASLEGSLFKKGKLLLMDEVDGVTGSDIGGVPELIRILEKTAHPIIMTANNIWNSKFSSLRRKCKLIELKSIDTETITRFLKKILEKEGKEENYHFLRQIALKSQGDMRGALNDLQAHSIGEINIVNVEEKRNREEDIFKVLKKLFQEKEDNLNLFDRTKMSLDEILLWIEENIPKEYSGKALEKAYDALSNADKFRGRIYRQQFWRFLVYQNIFQTAGISHAKKNGINKFTKYERPKRILKIWINNQKTAKKKTIAKKLAKYSHCSTKKAMRDFGILRKILQSNIEIQNKLKLSEEEMDFLRK